MVKRGYSRAHVGDALQVYVGEPDAPALTHVEENLAPRVDDDAVTEGGAAVLMMADLRGSDDEQPGLDGAGAQQNMPMGFARGDGESGRYGDHVGIGLG